MGKVIKIIRSFISAAILALIVLPVALSLLLYLPWIQDFARRAAAGFLSDKLQTVVSVDKLHLKLFSRVTLDGFYVQDYHGDTLLYAGRIVVPLQSLNVFTGAVTLGHVGLEDVRFDLMQDSTRTSNLRQILQRIKRKEKREKKRKFRLHAAGVTIRDMDFRHRKFDVKPREYGVNFTDLDVRRFSLKVRDVSVEGDSVALAIDSLTLRERCGLHIRNLSTPAFGISGTGMRFDDLRLTTDESDVRMAYLYFDYATWKGYKDFLNDVRIRSEFSRSTVSFRTIAYFAQGLRRWQTVLRDASGSVDGPVSAMKGRIGRATARSTTLSLRFGIDGLPEVAETRFSFDVSSLHTDAADIEYFVQDIAGRSLGKSLPLVERMGRIAFSGHFDGLFSDFRADGRLQTDAGEASVDFDIRPVEGGATGFQGRLSTADFGVGRLLEASKLGRVSLSADVSGQFGQSFRMNARARVPKLEFNDYAYRDIALDGRFENRRFTGKIASDDPNMTFDFDGDLDFNGEQPVYHFDLNLVNADLHELHFNRRDTVSRVRCGLHAQASGTSLDNINGEAEIFDMTYVNQLDTVRTGRIRLLAENGSDRKLIGLYSPFADAELRGKLSYENMFSYFSNTLRSYLPSLSERPRTAEDSVPSVAGASRIDSYYLLDVNVKRANNVAGIFSPGLRLAQGTKLVFLFNPESDVFSLTLDSELIENERFFVSDLKASCRNQGDSISLFVTAADLFAKGMYMPDFSVIGGAKENRINLAARFNNSDNGTYALLGTTSTLGRDPQSGVPQVRVRFNPSSFTTNGRTWRIWARQIVFDSTRIDVDRFSISSGQQRLSVDGVASRSDRDTLRLQLHRFDLKPFSRFAERQGYAFEGVTNGSAELISAYGGGVLRAGIDFDSVRVNGVPLVDSRFESRWDLQSRRALFRLIDRAADSSIVEGFYAPADKRLEADVHLRRIDLSLLDPVLKGVLRETQGMADASLRLTNPGGKLTLDGTIGVGTFRSTVDYTNVPYTMSDAVIDVRRNTMTLRPTELYGPSGGRAGFDMSFSFANPRNLSYEVHVRPDRTLVLNTTPRQNELFYGSVYATGSATIRGNKNGVSMDIVAASAENTRFFLPLGNGGSDISAADFIVFEDPAKRAADDSLRSVSRRRQFLSRRMGRESFRSDMDIKMALDIRPNAEMQLTLDQAGDNVLRGRGNGTLNLHVNPVDKEFTIYGDYDITEGSYRFSLQNFATRNFLIQEGSNIQWTGDPADALVNITAVYKLKASLAPLLSGSGGGQNLRRNVPVECIIRLSDRLTQPTLTFDVSVPNTDPETQSLVRNAMNTQEMMSTQFLWLLATQSFYADNSGTSQNLNIGAMGATVTGIEFLSTQLSNLLSTDRFRLAPKFRPKSEETSDEFGTEFYGELIKDRLIVEGDVSYDTGNGMPMNNRTANSLTGDVTLSLLLDEAGNLKVKAFTRTIDRFDENQGLQESGLGISYRQSFDNFGDLIRNIKDRRQRRRLSRELRQAERKAAADSLKVAADGK